VLPSCTRDHRDLHSFPTRRSSDLNPGRNDGGCAPCVSACSTGMCRPGPATSWPPCTRSITVTSATAMSEPLSTATGLHDALRERSEEHTSELQSRFDLVCRLLLEK